LKKSGGNMLSEREKVELLIEKFWELGYLTVSRKYGKYLKDPQPIGKYEVEAIGKIGSKYIIGIVLNEKDVQNPNILSKLRFLATRKSRITNKNAVLLIGVENSNYLKALNLINSLEETIKRNIILFELKKTEEKTLNKKDKLFNSNRLFF
jgi:hypothetical protein